MSTALRTGLWCQIVISQKSLILKIAYKEVVKRTSDAMKVSLDIITSKLMT